MRPIISAAVIFLLMVLSISTPATAQFGSSNPPLYVFAVESGSDGSLAMRWFSTHCVEKTDVLFDLHKVVKHAWAAMPVTQIKVTLQGTTPGTNMYVNLDRKVDPGTYKMVVKSSSTYDTIGSTPNGPCTSGIRGPIPETQIVFSVGGSRDYAPNTPIALASDQFTAVSEGVLSFGAYFPNAVQMVFYQREADGKVRYAIVDHPSTGGPFYGRVRINLPKNFKADYPISLTVNDHFTKLSVSGEALPATPPALTTKQ